MSNATHAAATHIACCDLTGFPRQEKYYSPPSPCTAYSCATISAKIRARRYLAKLVFGKIAAHTYRHHTTTRARSHTRGRYAQSYPRVAAIQQLDHDRAECGVTSGRRDWPSCAVNVHLRHRRGACRHCACDSRERECSFHLISNGYSLVWEQYGGVSCY